MINTYGFRAINATTFNTQYGDRYTFPREVRNLAVLALRVHNAVLNVLGYIPGVSIVSGSIRIFTGVAMIAATVAIGNRNANGGHIIGRWYDEAIATGVAQVVRGALEAFVPFGWIANAALDVIATPINLIRENLWMSEPGGCLGVCDCCAEAARRHLPDTKPYEDLKYPTPFQLLLLV